MWQDPESMAMWYGIGHSAQERINPEKVRKWEPLRPVSHRYQALRPGVYAFSTLEIRIESGKSSARAGMAH